MRSFSLILLILLLTQGQETKKIERKSREIDLDNAFKMSDETMILPSGDGSHHDPHEVPLSAGGGPAHDFFPGTVMNNYLVNGVDGSLNDRPAVTPHVTTNADPVGFDAIRNYAKGANAAIDTYGPAGVPKISGATGAISIGGVRVPGPIASDSVPSGPASPPIYGPTPGQGHRTDYPGSLQGLVSGALHEHGAVNGRPGIDFPSQTHGPDSGPGVAGPPYDFDNALNGVNNRQFGNSDRFISDRGQFAGDRAPSVFNYQASFGGKDYNHLQHILPPGGKSIEQLQAEANQQLRVIMDRARGRQEQALRRIDSLKGQYGVGTIGFHGWKDNRFHITGNIDLGTHKAIDLGTSIDASQLITADGKLKLPVQNIYHKKTIGIKIPEPYPVKEEVPVPQPYPVNRYIKVPVPVPVPVPTTSTVVAVPPATQTISIPRPVVEYGAPASVINYNVPATQTIGAQRPVHIQNDYLPPAQQLNINLTPPMQVSLLPRLTNQIAGNQVDYSSEESNEVTGANFGRNTFSIQPSQSISETSSLGLLPPTNENIFMQNSYGPPAAGPVNPTSNFMGNSALANFPPYNFSHR